MKSLKLLSFFIAIIFCNESIHVKSISEAEKTINLRLRDKYKSEILKLNNDYKKLDSIQANFKHSNQNNSSSGVLYKLKPYSFRIDYFLDKRELIFLNDNNFFYLYDKNVDQFNRIKTKDTMVEILLNEKLISDKILIQKFNKTRGDKYSISFFLEKKQEEGIINIYIKYDSKKNIPIIEKILIQKDIKSKPNEIIFYNFKINNNIKSTIFDRKLVFKK